MNYGVTPESHGIASKDIAAYVDALERKGLSTHDLLIAKGNDVVFEGYWAPFDKDFKHRQYSVSKSIVSLAVGFCEQDGLICLDHPISKYFPEECKNIKDENFKNQTVRHMLTMTTAKFDRSWFTEKPADRVRFYFDNDNPDTRPSGTFFHYDSSGSFVLCAMVERVTGKRLLTYLREKFLDKIGVSSDIDCLEATGGHSWGDSAILCTARDLLKIARFTMNLGAWNGEQLLNRAYVTAAIAKQVDNNPMHYENYNTYGYGYQIWRTRDNSFFFNGMGCQLAVCVPDKDLILIYNGDNQGYDADAKSLIINGFFDTVVANMKESPIPVCQEDANALKEMTAGLKLAVARGEMENPLEKEINGVTYLMGENEMGIKEFTLRFDKKGGTFSYVNAQGKKEIPFLRGENAFFAFPQEGYADRVGTLKTKGVFYRAAASCAWVEPRKLYLKVQIIDKYFGRLHIAFRFLESGVCLQMEKTAEDFLNEYVGRGVGMPYMKDQ